MNSKNVTPNNQSAPRLIIAGTGSGAGKTTVTLGLMKALAQRGLSVQGFKCGPDYIDPTYHTAVTGRASRNLDAWMTSPAYVKQTFQRASAGHDISIIEGVMGLYDGKDPLSNIGSTAEIAMITQTPVILVVDVRSMARSAAAIVLGFQQLEPELNIAGVIVNRCGSAGHYTIVKKAIEQMCNIPVVGWLKRDEDMSIPERHLGLVPAIERGELEPLFQRAADVLLEGTDLDLLLELATSALPLSVHSTNLAGSTNVIPSNTARVADTARTSDTLNISSDTEMALISDKTNTNDMANATDITNIARLANVKDAEHVAQHAALHIHSKPDTYQPVIAVARDAAFNFYYPDNLELLEAAGARLKYFSPLAGEGIPAEADSIYLGGGFPEEFAAVIAGNERFLEGLREAARSQMPLFAECGGYMVLAETLTDREGRTYTMAGIIPAQVQMQKKRAALGYREASAVQDSFLLKQGEVLRGHEFHYSTMTYREEGAIPYAYETKGLRGSKQEGYASGSIVAGYTHVHLGSDPQAAQRWVEHCRLYREHQA
ncbi:cobyrinate a,c-diamide synthase [Paenibacillus cucumis (ex Kampfer et al. 2016)]|uniref:Cobyrinate a,c-diamide synthase n=1 Tax=Paenibacillus cucumis (ex Kampfer et al. 2016) TaxID=1776858 RepID=A0ABS7KIY4_9BACL|nr:cobyrinate a,c-diamide synthase [Paenibacillus cucumis (ex Kampfer et al. 2016)]MBY0204128.1 cobyrinate a,c-diamide synthase [Paenibacillus cucumis (ex Kampfer et al. 2016)]